MNLVLGGSEPYFTSIALSAKGTRLVAAATAYLGASIYTSTNYGVSWNPTDAPITNWHGVASSADGNKLVAVVGYPGGGIYIWQTTPSPKLIITPAGNGLLISWIVPSMPFVLQENADLNTADWIDVTTQPTLNLTNLHHEVSVPLSISNRFFRLKGL